MVRYARHTLDIDELGEHIKQGKRPAQLAMTWNRRVSYIPASSGRISQ
jgi:recombination associated protein RdgC